MHGSVTRYCKTTKNIPTILFQRISDLEYRGLCTYFQDILAKLHDKTLRSVRFFPTDEPQSELFQSFDASNLKEFEISTINSIFVDSKSNLTLKLDNGKLTVDVFDTKGLHDLLKVHGHNVHLLDIRRDLRSMERLFTYCSNADKLKCFISSDNYKLFPLLKHLEYLDLTIGTEPTTCLRVRNIIYELLRFNGKLSHVVLYTGDVEDAETADWREEFLKLHTLYDLIGSRNYLHIGIYQGLIFWEEEELELYGFRRRQSDLDVIRIQLDGSGCDVQFIHPDKCFDLVNNFGCLCCPFESNVY